MTKLSGRASEFHPRVRVRQWFHLVNKSFLHFPDLMFRKNFNIHQVFGDFNSHFHMRKFGEFSVISIYSTQIRFSYNGQLESCLSFPRRNVVIQYKGSSHYIQNNAAVMLQAGHWGIFDMNRTTEVHVGEDTHMIVVIFPANRIDSMLSLAERGLPLHVDSAREKKSQRFYEAVLALIHGELIYSTETGESIMQTLFLLMHEAILDYPMAPAGLLQAKKNHYKNLTIQYVNAHLHNTSFSIVKMAEALNCSVRTLNRILGVVHGESAEKLLWRIRVEHAGQQLSIRTNDHLSITSIAYACGFSSTSHFCRKFKERWGMTPSQFRKQNMGHVIS